MKRFLLIIFVLLAGLRGWADEGMWLVQDINEALEKRMRERGLELAAGEIYNAEAGGLTDAVVSLGFYCTASVISDKGLLITNYHCARSDIFALSTPEHDYLAEGFWAFNDDEELPVPGCEAYFLKKVIDVTAEANMMREEAAIGGMAMGGRRLSYILEKKYSEETGLAAYLSSMWAGEKYYISLYEVYKDLRLVAAPPESIGAFGGDEDNWEWPQHKCDFAIYRIYTAPDGAPAEYASENVPLKPVRKLNISLEGYKPSDFTMVIGYPGSSNRYSSSPETAFQQNLELPVVNELRKGEMEIMKGWMNADPEIWRKYSEMYFSLSNVGEMQEGEEACLKRFGVVAEKEAQERELQEWIEADSLRLARWGGLLEGLAEHYAATEWVERNKEYYRETLFRGTMIARTIFRMHNGHHSPEELRTILEEGLKATDPRVERDLLAFALEKYFTNVDTSFFGPYQKELAARFGRDFTAMRDWLWEGSLVAAGFSSEISVGAGARPARAEDKEKPMETQSCFEWEIPEDIGAAFTGDRLHLLLTDMGIKNFTSAQDNLRLRTEITALRREYTRALYEMREDKGLLQYPDANSTMRISYGAVCELSPRDGITLSWQSTSRGILEKYDPARRDFSSPADFIEKVERSGQDPAPTRNASEDENFFPVNFLSDNDITGGNSGSPVLNARGELIGLAFDGNKESLASDLSYTEAYNRCVSVDIRYVLWCLCEYAGLDRVMEEIFSE